MVFNSFKTNDEIFVTNRFGIPHSFSPVNYIKAISMFDLLLYFRNSFIICIVAITITVVCAVLFSYATARMEFPLAKKLQAFMTIGMFIPIQIIIIPLVILIRDFRLQNSLFALIIPYAVFQLSFSTLVLYGFFRGIPHELEEAAYIDGAGIFRTFFSVILPLVKSPVSTLIIFNFLSCFNEYYVANIVITNNAQRTLPLGLIYFKGQFTTDWGGMAAMMVLASVPVLVIYFIFSEQVEKAMTLDAALKG
jgi:raffinose/stachyose/melibiose transport system permease protein